MGRKPRVDRTPEEKADRAERDEERERLGDLSETRHRSDALLPMEGRSGTGSEGSPWGEKRCGRGNREGSSYPTVGTHARRKSLEIEILKNVVGE
jgi:hypothetical protein